MKTMLNKQNEKLFLHAFQNILKFQNIFLILRPFLRAAKGGWDRKEGKSPISMQRVKNDNTPIYATVQALIHLMASNDTPEWAPDS